jgi:long-chain acyl-CoA synthetase
MGSYYDQKPWLKTYPQWLPSKLTVPDHSILDAFLQVASTYPTDPCIHYFDRTLTYTEIGEMAVALAAALAGMGLGRGDRVIVVMQNIAQAVVACLAIWMRNSVVVPLNPMYTAEDLNYYLNDCGARLFICQDDIYAGQAGAD